MTRFVLRTPVSASTKILLLFWRHEASLKHTCVNSSKRRSDVQQAMRLSPRDPALSQWHNFLADAEIGLGNLNVAIEEATKAIDGGYRVFYAYLNLAAAHGAQG